MADIDHGRVGCVDERIQRHRTLADHEALGELRAADQPEMQRERETERPDRDEPEKCPGDDFNRPMPTKPPYLLT